MATPTKLTDAIVAKARANPDGTDKVLFDGAVPGLVLRVGKRRKTWRLQVHRRNGNQRSTVTHVEEFGPYPAMSLADARKVAQEILARDDPAQATSSGPTLKEAWAAYEAAMVKRKRSPGTITGYTILFGKLEAHHDKPIKLLSVKPAIIADLHTKLTIEGHAAGANSLARFISAVYRHALKTCDALPVRSPTRGVDMNKIDPRETAMAWADLAAWEQERLALKNDVQRELALFLLLTGLRRASACAARWEHLDLKNRTIKIPTPKGGKDRAFALPLSMPIVQCLRRVRDHGKRLYPGSPWIFPAGGANGHVMEIKSQKLSMNGHDLRRTFATLAMEVGTPPEVVSRLLNHSLGSVTAKYQVTKLMARFFGQNMEKISRYIIKGLSNG